MRRRMAAEELADVGRLDAKLKAMKAELKAAVARASRPAERLRQQTRAANEQLAAAESDLAASDARVKFRSASGCSRTYFSTKVWSVAKS